MKEKESNHDRPLCMEINKKISTGYDIGSTFFHSVYGSSPMLSFYKHENLRILAPQYFIDIIQQDLTRRHNAPSFDPNGFFEFMGIKMVPSPYEKIIIYHVNYPLFKKEDMIYEFDLSIFVS
jgi:hypothetical protein